VVNSNWFLTRLNQFAYYFRLMTDSELSAYFNNRPLPEGEVSFSAFESTGNVAHMVELAFARINAGGQGADTARGVLTRLYTHLEKQE